MRHVLFLCTGNSARSILAEAILAQDGQGRFTAHSAGSFPKDAPHPEALNRLRAEGYATDGFRSKSWDEFAAPDAPELDIVVTVCDNAAGETCPYWPGAPVTVHWGLPDPADATPADAPRAFKSAFEATKARIDALLALELDTLTLEARRSKLAQIAEIAT